MTEEKKEEKKEEEKKKEREECAVCEGLLDLCKKRVSEEKKSECQKIYEEYTSGKIEVREYVRKTLKLIFNDALKKIEKEEKEGAKSEGSQSSS